MSDTGIFSVLKFALTQQSFASDIEMYLAKNIAIDTIWANVVR
ncbi:hypothetical protein NT03LS_2717 [Listeria seeligeri FSL N1-067]|uniref:Uncharacterized protein n=1 Tax=Listeria seeligeri FSL N1-067 TaxID=702453 RepID=E3ZT69_LISSE|nr:hypothetical protein NT03LS_2717 [Listeria seeligeri FSL N1-067]